jgi:hypothetical protein
MTAQKVCGETAFFVAKPLVAERFHVIDCVTARHNLDKIEPDGGYNVWLRVKPSDEKLNMGIAIVVPAAKIVEVLNHPTLAALDEADARKWREANTRPWTVDSRSTYRVSESSDTPPRSRPSS